MTSINDKKVPTYKVKIENGRITAAEEIANVLAGETECPRCNGRGFVILSDDRTWDTYEADCGTCLGHGVVDAHYTSPQYHNAPGNNAGLKDGTAFR